MVEVNLQIKGLKIYVLQLGCFINLLVHILPHRMVWLRKHRHVVETVVTLLQTASMPLTFWGEVVLIAVYLINKMPTEVLQGDFPHNRLYQILPDYNFL